MDNLFLAWNKFRKGKKKRNNVQQFEFNLEDNLFQLYRDLKTKSYHHSIYKSFCIQDPKLRHIHKAAVRDRIVHHLVSEALQNIYDKTFIFDSYSCRPNKGTHRAVKRLENFDREASNNYKKSLYVLKCDIKKFFNSIDHEILVNILKRRIKDKDFIWLIKEGISSFNAGARKGIPLGNLTSQYFANIYLNELDQFVKHKLKIKYYIRYTDDFVVLSKQNDFLRTLIIPINNFLKKELKISLHPNKVTIRKFKRGIDFFRLCKFTLSPNFKNKNQTKNV